MYGLLLWVIHWFVINLYFEFWNVFVYLAMGCRVVREPKNCFLIYKFFLSRMVSNQETTNHSFSAKAKDNAVIIFGCQPIWNMKRWNFFFFFKYILIIYHCTVFSRVEQYPQNIIFLIQFGQNPNYLNVCIKTNNVEIQSHLVADILIATRSVSITKSQCIRKWLHPQVGFCLYCIS